MNMKSPENFINKKENEPEWMIRLREHDPAQADL